MPTHPLAARATSSSLPPRREPQPAQSALFTPAAAPEPIARLELRVPYPPSANTLYGVRAIKVRGKWIASPYKSAEHEEYVGAVHNAARVAALRNRDLDRLPFLAGVRLTVHLYRPIKRGDIDNPLKALFDSLNGVAWTDDSQVSELHVYRYDDKADPRVDLVIEALP